MPKTDVFVTNAGYGGTQCALSHGVPLVAAGDTEDKPEVSMRAARAGVGVNLRTGTPTADAVRRAIDAVLADRAYRSRAQVLAARIRQYDTFADIEAELEAELEAAAGARVHVA
ncbi:glycosyltransferase [Agromyces bauzanensis]|uniref:glycosyltransferase n=1 Tax=Agromyces bauzanensis TaxID=1308924 RepID=UPI00357121DE